MNLKRPIQVTQSFMPPLSEVVELLEGVWDRVYLTNNGPLLQELEKKLAAKNNVREIVTVSNGTIAIELALTALDIHGEVITTPFSFPATSTAIARTGNQPVFVDIDPSTWNIDCDAVDAAITSNTQAILPVHVFGRPCDVKRLQDIATRHRIKLIYDAAHANFVHVCGESIFNWGDCSSTSFHATKLFHTIEGGACFSPDPEVLTKIRQFRFFGYEIHNKQLYLTDIGTNAKMTEVSAAVGLANLKYIDQVLLKRRQLYELYLENLSDCSDLTFQQFNPKEYNYSYFPVLFRDEEQLLNVKAALNAEQIYPRRYFWPLLSDMPAFKDAKIVGDLSVAKNIASRILCLPLFPDLTLDAVEQIAGLLHKICGAKK